MKTIACTIAIVFLVGVAIGIIVAVKRRNNHEIEGDSFRVECSEKKKGE